MAVGILLGLWYALYKRLIVLAGLIGATSTILKTLAENNSNLAVQHKELCDIVQKQAEYLSSHVYHRTEVN